MANLPAMLQALRSQHATASAAASASAPVTTTPTRNQEVDARALSERLEAIEECVDSMNRWLIGRPRDDASGREEDGRGGQGGARRGDNSYLSRSPAEVEILVRNEPEFLKYLLENLGSWSLSTLTDFIKARRDYSKALVHLGPEAAPQIFDSGDEESDLLMRRMAAITERDRMMKGIASPANKPKAGTAPTPRTQTAGAPETPVSRSVGDSGCFNCGGPHMAKDCPHPFDPEYRAARRAWENSNFKGRGRGTPARQAQGQMPQQMGQWAPPNSPGWAYPGPYQGQYPGPGMFPAPVAWAPQYAAPAYVGQPNASAMSAGPVQAGPQTQ